MALVDTGADLCLMSKQFYDDVLAPMGIPLIPGGRKINQVDQTPLDIKGKVQIFFFCEKQKFFVSAYVVEDTRPSIILGRDFLEAYEAEIYLRKSLIILNTPHTVRIIESKEIPPYSEVIVVAEIRSKGRSSVGIGLPTGMCLPHQSPGPIPL
jgi:hypothetical protein